MLIRYGYEITVHCEHPTAMVCLLSVSEDRKIDIRVPENVFTTPIIATTTYLDSFGNRCRRLVAPSGDLTIWGDATIEDDGKIDQANFAAVEVPVAELPDSCLLYLMGSRYCETDKLSQTAWDLFGKVPPGWGRVQAVCDFVHRHIKFDYMQARATRTAFEAFEERIGVCRDFAHLAVTLCRCLNIPARYVNGHLGDIGVPVVDPMDFSATGRGGHSILATTSHGSGGSSSLEAGTRQISRSSTRSGRMSSSLFGSGHTRSSIR